MIIVVQVDSLRLLNKLQLLPICLYCFSLQVAKCNPEVHYYSLHSINLNRFST